MAVTIKDIAAAAGVSPSTVSRTCKDSPSISRDTKERIRRIMAQMGYEPNFEAEPSEAFSKTIGIILPPPSGMSTRTPSIWRSSAASGSSATSGGM